MSEKKQPQWKKVSELRPGTHGHTLNVQVVKAQVSSAGTSVLAPASMSWAPCTWWLLLLLLLQFVCARAPTCIGAVQVVVDRARGPKGQPLKVAECIVGDETGTIVFTARNEQGKAGLDAVRRITDRHRFIFSLTLIFACYAVDLAQAGKYITLRNAKIDMYRGSMRLAVDQWGKVEALEDASFAAKVGKLLGRLRQQKSLCSCCFLQWLASSSSCGCRMDLPVAGKLVQLELLELPD